MRGADKDQASVTARVRVAQWLEMRSRPRAADKGLDRKAFGKPHRAMFRVSRAVLIVGGLVAFGLGLGAGAAPVYASSPKPEAEPPPKPKPMKPSNLTGNALPKCEAGTYAAGHICKPAPPGFYAPSGGLYPVACPENMTSKSGSRSQSECYPEDGAPAPAPVADKKKGGH